MERYDSYKDSGVEWIGEIPSGWRKSKIKYHFNLLSGFPFNSEEITNEEREFPIIRIGNVTSGKTDVYFDGELLEKHPKVENGEYIVSLTGDFSIRKWENQTSLLNQRCGLMKNISMDDVRYLFYFLPFQFRILEKTKYFTTLKNLSNGELLDLDFIIPPLSEQQQIVSFLDTKTSLIDSLIEKTKLKIQLLKEKRTSLINEVVTKGLNPNVEMKDSGVEWIGEVPSHWETTKLKFQGDVIIGLSYSPENVVDEGGESTLVMRSSNVQNGKPSFHDNVFVNSDIPEKLRTKENDILICSRNGSRNLIGKNCLIPKENENLTWGVFMTVFRSKYPKFIYWLLNSPVFESQSGLFLTSTINQLTVSTLENMIVPFVSDVNEQQQIVEYLDEHTQLIDKTISIEEKRIELLKEYRQSLISEVVTGKRKVVE
jgi:type I restriction enzyme, S subunit